MVRLAFGTSDNKILVPGCLMVGAVVTSLCDFIARMVFSPVELPISAITAMFGAPHCHQPAHEAKGGNVMKNTPVMATRNLVVGYPKKEVLTSVNLDFHASEFISLLGPNGVGKSTLLRTLSHLLPRLTGEIFVAGKALEDYTP